MSPPSVEYITIKLIVDNKKNAQHLVNNTKHQISVIALENVAKTKRHNNIDSSNSLLSKIVAFKLNVF